MPIQEDIKPERAEDEGDEQETAESTAPPEGAAEESGAPSDSEAPAHDESEPDHDREAGDLSPAQLGARRFVYAAYFAGGIAIAFIADKALGLAWYRLQTWKPALGEPRDEVILPIAGLIGVGAAVYYWYRTRARQLAEEVAAEMSKVTWPSRTEVQNGTFVVVVTTIVSTVFFALMDRFWGFVTNLVYGGS
jgi:preprotein translocase subunit SecE